LDRNDIAAVDGCRCTRATGGSRDSAAARLQQPNLDDAPNIVIVAIDSALAARAKLKRFPERVLCGWSGISDWILKRIL